MGANISNCQFTKLGDTCNSSVSIINTTLEVAASNHFILNHEKSKFESTNNEYWFSCLDGSKEYNGTVTCDIKKYASIVCGTKNITFQHNQNCLFGFQFRSHEMVIFQSNDLEKPLVSLPLPTKQMVVTTQIYDSELQEKWVLRNGYSGYVSNSNIVSNSIIASPKSVNTPFDTSASGISEGEIANNKGYAIPVDSSKLESGGSLSFNLPIVELAKDNIELYITDKDNKRMITLEFKKCCGKILDFINEFYDRFIFPEKFSNTAAINLTLSWLSSVFFLYITSPKELVSVLPTELKSIPSRAEMIYSSSKKSLNPLWGFKNEAKGISPNSCTIKEINERCKSSSVTIANAIKSDVTFLRYGFLFSKSALAPYTITVSQGSNSLATLVVSSNIIKITSGSYKNEINLSSELKTGNWFSGDIFIVSSAIHEAIDTDDSIKCKNYSDSCLETQKNYPWMSILNEGSLLRYSYLMKRVVENEALNSITNTPVSSSSASSDYSNYLYISYNNCVITRLGINVNSFDTVTVSNSKGVANLVYWRLKSGISPSIPISSSTTSNLKTQILKDLEDSKRDPTQNRI
ncbi:hypothetical protein HWI79_1889 [Cryptosporidium felis]|nr:hypothetical protein HWI79_1889 [Cryptosporidium felis]